MKIFDSNPKIAVTDSEFGRLLGFPPGQEWGDRVVELAVWAREWYAAHGKPWVHTHEAEALEVGENSVRVEKVEFKSRELRDRLTKAKAAGAVLVAAGAGVEAEEEAQQRWKSDRPDEYFFLEVYASAVVEHLITTTGARLCDWAEHQKMVVLPHYSPGYPGWELEDQHALLTLLRLSRAPHQLDVEVMTSGQLRPKKSQLALFGLAAKNSATQQPAELIPCHHCSYTPCAYRRASYRETAYCVDGSPVPDVAPLKRNGIPKPAVPLKRGFRYSIGEKALRRWAEEHLQIETAANGDLRARFRYHGSTCSNMGTPLTYDFSVWLGYAADGYRVVKTMCSPAVEDSGVESTCSFIEGPERHLAEVAGQPPIIGRHLDDAVQWAPDILPSGCLCRETDRNHKWKLVLQTLHYRLAHHEENA